MSQNQTSLSQNHVTLALSLLSVFAGCIFTLMTGNLKLFGFMLLIPIAINLIGRLDYLFIAGIALVFSSLSLPALPATADASKALFAACLGLIIASGIIHKSLKIRREASSTLAILFILLIILTSSIRGFGFRVLGGDAMGGSALLVQLIIAILFVFSDTIKLTQKQWLTALTAHCLFTSLPMLADLIFYVSSGKIYHHFYFMNYTVSGILSTMVDSQTGGVWRLQRAGMFAPFLFYLSFALWKSKKVHLWQFIFLASLSLGLAGISGHRSALLGLLMFSTLFYLFLGKKPFALKAIFLGGISTLTYGLLFLCAPLLPNAAQRTLTVVPGLPVSQLAQISAMQTTSWRIGLWLEALRDWKEFFWIGKGVLLSKSDSSALQALEYYEKFSGISSNNWEAGILRHDYHNGPIALLLDLGIWGLLLGSAIIAVLNIENWKKYRRKKWTSPALLISFQIMITIMLVRTVSFFVIYGDVRSISHFFVLALMIKGVVTCDNKLTPPTQGIDS